MSKTAKGRYANIGTVSYGTLRDEDLIESFASELASLYRYTNTRMPPHVKKLLAEVDGLDFDGEDDDGPETHGEIVNELMQELEHFAPPFGYFGSSEGDGADFGFWISPDAIRDAIHDGDLLVQDDGRGGRQDEIPLSYTGLVYHVSDHGNESLHQYTRGQYAYTIW